MIARCILFGKLPAHGDFVARGIDMQQQEQLDRDISASIGLAMERFAEQFERSFLKAPPWRCIWPEDAGFIGGSLSPSIDQTGRIYPIFLSRHGSTAASAKQFAAACEGLLFDAIPRRWTADTLFTALQSLVEESANLEESAPAKLGWWLDGGHSLPNPTPHLRGPLPLELLGEMLAVMEQIA
jgi:type VI secretion system ImpM family protein